MRAEAMKQDLKLAVKEYQIYTLAGDKLKRVPASVEFLGVEIRANSLFAELKASHKKEDCVQVRKLFGQIKDDFSFSNFYPEAIFLRADCHMQMREYEQALILYSGLIDLYPDHLVTGHALIKMVEILRILDRPSEAWEALKVIKIHFSEHPEILKSAEELALDMGRNL